MPGMNIDEKEALAMVRDMGPKAAAIRIHAARLAVGMGQDQLAQDVGEGMTKQKVNNAEKGANYPPPTLMRYFYRQHRIDFTFLMHGDFAHLHADVQERLLSALSIAHSEWDQRESSGRSRAKQRTSQQQTQP